MILRRLCIIVMLCLLSVWTTAQEHKAGSATPITTEIERFWAEAIRLADQGDSNAAEREIERVEQLSMKKFKEPEQKNEWLSIKARLYAFHLHNLDSACNIQLRACEALKGTKDKHHQLAMSFLDQHSYELLNGSYYLAYGSALLADIETRYNVAVNQNGSKLTAKSLVRSCLALRQYKEALGVSEWLKRQNWNEFKKSNPLWRRYKFYPLASCIGMKIMSEIQLGYIDDAVAELEWLDGIADSINATVTSNYDKVLYTKYALLPRIHLLTELKKYDEALRFASSYKPGYRVDIINHYHLLDDIYYHMLLMRIYSAKGMNQEAEKELFEAMSSSYQLNKNHPYMAELLYTFAKEIAVSNPIYAINMLGKARQILRTCMMENSDQYADVLQLVTEIGHEKPELQRFLPKWVAKTTLNRYQTLRHEFAECTESERLHIWTHGPYKSWFGDFLPYLMCEHRPLILNDTLVTCAYAGVQTYKSILLSSEVRTRQLILQNKDTKLTKQYDELMKLKNQMFKICSEGGLGYDDLRKRVYSLDTEITKKMHLTDDLSFVSNLKINNLYLKKIDKGEMFVDFVNYHTPTGKEKYGAFIALNCDKGRGILALSLFNASDLQLYKTEDAFSSSVLYQKVWKLLDDICKRYGLHHIYFSASGQLHNIAIEYLLDDEGRSISDKYPVYRVLSIKESLMKRKSSQDKHRRKYKKVELWGDMDFSAFKSNKLFGQINSRLPFSRMEVKDIERLLPSGVNSHTHIGQVADKESFKAMGASRIDILHMATHGFYWNPGHQNSTFHNDELFGKKAKGYFTSEDKRMNRSLLLLSKVNAADEYDGILTATEISMMDFSHVDLVTLSACQTALGDLSSEGTLGLQRAFKKAGVNSLLISLKPVHDESTYLLMTNFYRYLFEGKTKHEALRMAQHDLKTKWNGIYAKPQYWAPFILVDALD